MYFKGGAEVDLQTEEGETSLMAAINSEQVESVETLLKFGASVNVGDDQMGLGPLHLACSIGNVAVLKKILAQEECDVNKVGKKYKSPITDDSHYYLIKV